LIFRKRAFERQFQKWRFEKRKAAHNDEMLIERVKDLYHRNFSHKSILRVLNDFDHISINSQQLKRLRLHPSIRLLYRSPQIEESQDIVLNAVREKLSNGQAIRYGRTYLQTILRHRGILVSL